MKPGHYTELFFLDEATALAAGHRPCAECRRERFTTFREAWQSARPRDTAPVSAVELDHRLHAERITSNGSKRTHSSKLKELPNGVFVTHPDWGESAYLVWNDVLLAWTAGGYAERIARLRRAEVTVLTPKSIVGALRDGYIPEIHPTATAPA